jgi:UDP-glucose 4-epimerase
MKTILVSNIHSPLGQRIAQQLAAHATVRLVGLSDDPAPPPAGCAAVQCPSLARYTSGPDLAELLRVWQVDTFIHLDIAGEDAPAPAHEHRFQHNVLGTMAVLGACLAAGVRRVIVRSSTLVCGARPNNPAFLNDQHPPTTAMARSLVRDYSENELFAARFAQSHPELELLVLRCAGLVGQGVWSPLNHYLTSRAPRTVLGFNPRIQVLHPDDAAAAFVQAALGSARGTLHIAADDPLPLKQAIRLAGRQPLPLPGLLINLALFLSQRSLVLGAWPYDLAFLRLATVGDTRRAQMLLHWQPAHSAHAALCELAQRPAHGTMTPPTARHAHAVVALQMQERKA